MASGEREMTWGGTTAEDVIALVDLTTAQGIGLWLEGGWAVDAWLGRQTRAHQDVDVIVAKQDVARLVELLFEHGFAIAPRAHQRAWNFVLARPAGLEVDVHIIEFDAAGHGVYGPAELEWRYERDALAGRATILGREVACITPEWLVEFHLGYEPDANDRADVAALCDRFRIAVPDPYRETGAPEGRGR
jgi:lincosamide nucleotidyltransferase A/C/D/E